MVYLASHARLHAWPHARVASWVLHLHGHALPCLIHELIKERKQQTSDGYANVTTKMFVFHVNLPISELPLGFIHF